MRDHPKADSVDAYLSTIGVRFSADGGQRTKRDSWGCFAWNTRFARVVDQRSRELSQPYYCGLAHIKDSKFRKDSVFYAECPLPPRASDVLYSLLLDGEAQHASFSDWCADFGGGDDSIKSFETYRACCEIGKQLSAFFSVAERAELAKLLEDY